MRFSTFGLVIFSALGSSRALAPANVTWSNCPDNTGVECATVQVPLDWADESKGMIPIALSRVPAKTPQREGYMFFNPGGPGGSGTEFVQNLGPIIQFILGRGMEIISWDPPGSRVLVLTSPYSLGKPTTKRSGTRCTDVNLYGISYGTVIATYLTQMFPDRVGRVIIDGVLDPEKYGNNIPMKWAEADVYDVDFALKSWTEACAGSKKCPFSNQNDTSSTLLTKIDTILNTAYERYDGSIPTFNDSGLFTWPYDNVANSIQSNLYQAMRSDDNGQMLAALEQHQSNSNSTQKVVPPNISTPIGRSPYSIMPLYDTIPPDVLSNIAFAVFCGDAVDDGSTTTEDVFKETVRISQSTSRIFGSLFPIDSIRSLCHKWTSRAVERLPQKINKPPKNVVLVLGNMGDPITPYYSARRLASSDQLGTKARLVLLKSIGHSTRESFSPIDKSESVS
ncbi:hypothetical protein FS842_001133 [Serendipita sp. 407]|nr:hypothetical protein FS842_001133 [Serendipita sp. 407]